MALLGCACAAACATPRSNLPAATMPPGAQSAREILPADLDVALWLDVTRLRSLWSVAPDRQLARVLAEYGLFAATSDAEAAFWIRLLSQSKSVWIACRPSHDGCRDTVLFARGRYDHRDPLTALPDTAMPMDLGAGWFRYGRKHEVQRQQAARVYFAPPDRIVVVTPAEVDAVERSLEQGHAASSELSVEERGLFSMTLRPPAIARLVEKRAPAAAQLLREARLIRIWLDSDPQMLALSVSVDFSDRERAERARHAFAILFDILKVGDARNRAANELQVVGSNLVMHFRFAPDVANSEPEPGLSVPNGDAEPAAQ